MNLPSAVLIGAKSKERTEAEFRGLLGDAGFTVQRIVKAGSAGLGIIEAVAGSTSARANSKVSSRNATA
jgi:hypothetical protein